MLNETYGATKDVTNELEEMGIIDLKVFEDRETNFFVHYNWLHFLTQIVLFLQKVTDVSQLLTLITKFETWVKKPTTSLTITAMQQDQYMQSPVTLSIFYEPLLKVMLERLDVSELHYTLQGLFHKGSASYVHYLAHLRSPEGIALALKYLEKDKSLLTKRDSLGNTLLHYAAYLRNTHLIEEMLSKFSQ